MLNGYAFSLLGILMFISLWSLRNYFFDENYQRENNRAAGQFLTAHALPNDLVIVSASYTSDNLEYYSQIKDLNIIGYPSSKFSEWQSKLSNDKNQIDVRGRDIGAKFVKENKIEPDLKLIIGKRKRFWLFLSRIFHSDPNGLIRKFCDENYIRELHGSWGSTELILYKTGLSALKLKD